MIVLGKYGQAKTITFPLIDRGAVDFEATPVVHAVGDSKIDKNDAGFGNTTNAFAHRGLGVYSLALTAAEMTAARISVTIIDQTVPKAWEDQAVLIETYGNASAEHAFDLDSATVTPADGSITAAVLGADCITNAKIADAALNTEQFAADFLTYTLVADDAIRAENLYTGCLTADAFAADALIAATFATGCFTADAFAADCLVAASFATGAFTADVFAADALAAATFATGCFTADAFAADCLVAASFATGAFTADAFAADALVAATFATNSISADALAADAVAEINGIALSVPAVGSLASTVLEAVSHLYAASFYKHGAHKTGDAAGELRFYNSSDTQILKAAISDDGDNQVISKAVTP